MTTSLPDPTGPSLRFQRLFPALLLACFATVVFWWNPFGAVPQTANFEVALRPSVDGEARLIVNVDGTGMRRERRISHPIKAGIVNHVRFPIPAGLLYEFMLAPLSTEGEVEILKCWMTSESGDLVKEIPPVELVKAANQPMAIGSKGEVRLPARIGGAVTSLTHKPRPPINLVAIPPPPAWQIVAVFCVSLALAACWPEVAARLPWSRYAAAFLGKLRRHPRKAVFAAALLSMTLSCFPIIFCGDSFVSPDNGIPMLYETFPGVPGAQGGRTENSAGSDTGAMMYWHMPISMIQHRAIFEDGEFPFWNRYNWHGVSLWAQSISMLGDPLHWPTVITGGASWAWDLKFLVAKLLFAFGIGLLVLSTSRNLIVSLLLTLSAPFIGFFCYRLCHPAFFALCYSPWVLLPWVEAARARSLRRVAGWAGLLMFANWWEMNSGTAKESMSLLLVLNVAGGLALLNMSAPWIDRWKRLAIFAWANLLFVLLSAPLWYLFLDALGKAWTIYDVPKIHQIQPGASIGFFDDIFYRQFMPLEFLVNPSANFFVLLGAAWAMVRVRVLIRDGMFRAILLAAVPAAAVAFGIISPLVLAKVPLIRSIYHFDNSFSCPLFILAFVVAGYGLRECHHRMRSAEWRGDWATMMTLVGVLVAAFFGLAQASHRMGFEFVPVGQPFQLSEFCWMYGTALVIALAVLPWAWRAVRLRQPMAATWILIAAAAFVTLHFRHGMYLVTRFDIYTMNPKKRLDLREIQSPAVRFIKEAIKEEPSRVVGVDWVMAGTNIANRFETIGGAEALHNPLVREVIDPLGISQVWSWKYVVPHHDIPAKQRALDFLGVRYYLDRQGAGGDFPGLRRLASLDLDVSESASVWPRAFFTDTVITYREPAEIAALVQQGDGRPFAAMLPAGRARVPLPPRELPSRTVVPARKYHLTQNSTSFEIDAASPGLAVLMEADVPGDIEAYVDDQPARSLRINHAFRGVVIEKPGRHLVKFSYRPAVLDKALGMSAIGLVGLLVSVVALRRLRPRPDAPVS